MGLSSAICARQERQAARHLFRPGIAIAGRAALEDVGDEHRFARQADGQQHGVEQLPGAAHEGLALAVLLGARRFADDQPLGTGVADAEHGLRARLAQLAGRTGRDALAQRTPVDAGLERRRRRRAGARAAAGWAAAARSALAAAARRCDFWRRVPRHPAIDAERVEVGVAHRSVLHALTRGRPRAAGAACALTTAPGRRCAYDTNMANSMVGGSMLIMSSIGRITKARYEYLTAPVDVDLLEAEVAERRHHERRGVTGDRERQHQARQARLAPLGEEPDEGATRWPPPTDSAGPGNIACRRRPKRVLKRARRSAAHSA